MPGYFMGMVHGISDEAGFGAYQDVALPIVEKYGGKPILYSKKIEAADGDWAPMGIIVFEFESSAQARKWYNSSEYQAVLPKRLNTTNGGVVFVDGG